MGRPRPQRRAQSLYRGVRVTLTQDVRGNLALVTVSVKDSAAPWSDWSALAPAQRIEGREIHGVADALAILQEALAGMAESQR